MVITFVTDNNKRSARQLKRGCKNKSKKKYTHFNTIFNYDHEEIDKLKSKCQEQ